MAEARENYEGKLDYNDIRVHRALFEPPSYDKRYRVAGFAVGDNIYISKNLYRNYFACPHFEDGVFQHELWHTYESKTKDVAQMEREEGRVLALDHYNMDLVYAPPFDRQGHEIPFDKLNLEQRANAARFGRCHNHPVATRGSWRLQPGRVGICQSKTAMHTDHNLRVMIAYSVL